MANWFPRKAVIAVSGIGLVLFSVYYLSGRRPRPDLVADEFSAALQERDWKKIYQMGSEEEKSIQPWGEEEFIIMMTELTRNWPNDLGPIKIIGDAAGQTTWKHFEFHFKCKLNSPDATTDVHWIPVAFSRTRRDWTPELRGLPLDVSRMGARPFKEKAEALIQASKVANMPAVVRYYDRREFSFERLEQYMLGKLEWKRIERYVPR